MIKYHYLDKKNFHDSRKGRIGSSDIPKMLPDIERPTQSLAGFGNTAITVYMEKTGQKERSPAGFSAEMGHYLENKSQERFIRDFFSPELAQRFRIRKEEFESRPDAHAINYQSPPFHHSTVYHYDGMIVHPDTVYDPPKEWADLDYEILGPDGLPMKRGRYTVNGVMADFRRPFIVEAKSAQLMAAKRRDGSLIHGYDFDLTTWQGIPLKHYVQIQYQLALFQVDSAFLSLIYDTSNYQAWRVDASRTWQGRIMDAVGRMIKHIKTGTMPREMAMNAADVKEIFPRLDRDYCMLSGDELKTMKEACKTYHKAADQEKKWKRTKQDAQDAAAVLLKDFHELREGSEILAKWTMRKGAEIIEKPDPDSKSSFLDQLKKIDPPAYRYLLKRGYVKQGNGSRYVSIKYKGDI